MVSLGERTYNLDVNQQLCEFSLVLFKHLEVTWVLLGDRRRFRMLDSQRCVLINHNIHIYVYVRRADVELSTRLITRVGVLEHVGYVNYQGQYLGNILSKLVRLGHMQDS